MVEYVLVVAMVLVAFASVSWMFRAAFRSYYQRIARIVSSPAP